MKKQEFRLEAAEIVRKTIRESELIYALPALEHVPQLLDSVAIDKEYILDCVSQELKKPTKNPINALLGLVGLRIVRTQGTVDRLDAELGDNDEITVEEDGNGKLDSFLKLDAKKLEAELHLMEASLLQEQRHTLQDRDSEQRQNQLLQEKLHKAEQQHGQLTLDFEHQRITVAERAQYMLSLTGRDIAASPLAQQVLGLLEDLGLQVYWDAEDAPFSRAAMFTELHIEEPDKQPEKPCLICNGAIFVKGLKFIP